MFSKPTRNHVTVIPEQIGALGVIALTFGASFVFEMVTDSSGRIKYFLSEGWQLAGDRNSLVSLAVFALILVYAVISIIRWYKTVFYIEDGHLVFERNTLMKKKARLPLSCISTVNIERNVFERIVGTAKVKLDINSSATADKTDFVFVLSLDKAKAFEQALLNETETAGEQRVDDREPVCCFDGASVVRHILLSQPVAELAIVGLAAALLVPLDNKYFGGRMLGEMLPVVAFAALSWLVRTVFQFLSFWNFRVECDEKTVFISSGMLKKKSYSFEKDRINALTVRQPLLARAFGLCCAEVAVIGLGNDKKETPQISLLVKKSELDKILSACVQGFECSSEQIKAHGADLIRTMLFYMPVSAALAVAAAFVSWPLCAVVVAAGVGLSFASYKSKHISADDRIFSCSQGFFNRKSCFIKYSDLQTVQLRTNILLQKFNVGRIRVSILSSSAMSVHTTGCFNQSIYETLCRRVMDEDVNC